MQFILKQRIFQTGNKGTNYNCEVIVNYRFLIVNYLKSIEMKGLRGIERERSSYNLISL